MNKNFKYEAFLDMSHIDDHVFRIYNLQQQQKGRVVVLASILTHNSKTLTLNTCMHSMTSCV